MVTTGYPSSETKTKWRKDGRALLVVNIFDACTIDNALARDENTKVEIWGASREDDV